MTSDSLFVLAVSILTLGGVFVYLLRVEALAKKLEERVRNEELTSHSSAVPLAQVEDLPR